MKRLLSSISINERNRKIYQAHLRGTTTAELAAEFDLTRSSIHNIINKQKASTAKAPRKLTLGKDYLQYKMARLRPK